jgi:hypothetical protein
VNFSTATPTKLLRRAPKLTLHCASCDNDVQEDLYWIVSGRYLKYMGQVVAGKKNYVYVCPICKHVGKEISRDQARILTMGESSQ